MLSINTKDYWNSRYDDGGNSGFGSYDRYAAFKAEVLNDFISVHGIRTMSELGCGDGNQLGLFEVSRYTGYDISSKAVRLWNEKYRSDDTKSFKVYEPTRPSWKIMPQAELAVSLDVIYHILEDETYESYMRDLFMLSERFVAIYANNMESQGKIAQHLRFHRYTDWVEKNRPDWTLCGFLPNRYPVNPKAPNGTPLPDFYFFSRHEKIAPKFSCLFEDPAAKGMEIPDGEANKLMLLARESIGTHDFAKAAECLKAAMANPAARLQAANNLGAVLAAQGMHQEAEEAMKTVLALDPGNRQARINLTKMYLRLERWADLNHFFRELLELRQSTVDVASRWPLIKIKVENLS
jgi:tetratricopeptide (TPR) repeat protein